MILPLVNSYILCVFNAQRVGLMIICCQKLRTKRLHRCFLCFFSQRYYVMTVFCASLIRAQLGPNSPIISSASSSCGASLQCRRKAAPIAAFIRRSMRLICMGPIMSCLTYEQKTTNRPTFSSKSNNLTVIYFACLMQLNA